jgi:hypothetical protein
MSNPTDLPPQNPDDRPEGTPAAEDQPTEAYPAPAADRPTEAYPPAPEPAYAAPTAPPAPVATATDTRPRRLAWVALGLAVGGLVLVLLAYIPLLWVSFALALVGGILLLAGLVVGIMVLVKKAQGGKGLGIGAIVVSVLGGGAWVGALIWSLILIGLASSGGSIGTVDPSATPPAAVEESATPAPSASASAEAEATDAPEQTTPGVYDEAAYLAEVRPTLTALFTEIDPTITDEVATMVFPDESLVQIGQAVISGDLDRESLVATLVSEDGNFTQEQAERFFDTIDAAAQKHLVQ